MAETKMQFGRLESGFFRYLGKLYFAMPHGHWTIHYPVVNGKISKHSDGSCIFPEEMINVIPLQEVADYGMEIKQGENPFDQRFWS